MNIIFKIYRKINRYKVSNIIITPLNRNEKENKIKCKKHLLKNLDNSPDKQIATIRKYYIK
jgi:hypothetical protein